MEIIRPSKEILETIDRILEVDKEILKQNEKIIESLCWPPAVMMEECRPLKPGEIKYI